MGRPSLRRASGLLVLSSLTLACSSGLGASEWLWCKQNLTAVDLSAERLGLPKTAMSYEEPTWLPAFAETQVTFNNTVLLQHADFIASCDRAADANGVAEGRLAWCQDDGFDEAWTAAVELGFMSETSSDAFSYKAIPFAERVTNPDFMAACRAAYAERSG